MMQDNKPPTPNTESIVKAQLTKREWNVIQMMRQIRYGSMTVQKQAGVIIMVEPSPTIKVAEDMDITLPIGV